jgi:hypothetical protein
MNRAGRPTGVDGTGVVPTDFGVRSRVRAALPVLKRPVLAGLFWLGLAVWAAFVLGSTWAASACGRPGLWPTP